MTAYEVATIGVTVTVLTQILKKALPGEGWGIYLAGGVSFIAVVLWVLSGTDWPPHRTDLWAFFSGWVSVFATSAGIYSVSTSAPAAPADRPAAGVVPPPQSPAEPRAEAGVHPPRRPRPASPADDPPPPDPSTDPYRPLRG